MLISRTETAWYLRPMFTNGVSSVAANGTVAALVPLPATKSDKLRSPTTARATKGDNSTLFDSSLLYLLCSTLRLSTLS